MRACPQCGTISTQTGGRYKSRSVWGCGNPECGIEYISLFGSTELIPDTSSRFVADNPKGPSMPTRVHVFKDCPAIVGIASLVDERTKVWLDRIGVSECYCQICKCRLKKLGRELFKQNKRVSNDT